LFGYWSHFLTEAAHQMRLKGKRFPCSGYLYAIRKKLVQSIPEDILSEDVVITEMVRDQGYQVVYAPEAKVYVKYPNNFKDWLDQKVRSTGGYTQKLKVGNFKLRVNKARNFVQEILYGFRLFFIYPKILKEFYWTFLLYLARLYLWFLIFWKIRVKHKKFTELWSRIESTK
ncbi:MAG: glycosyltransferase, partial [Minisyncoccia bacterium]